MEGPSPAAPRVQPVFDKIYKEYGYVEPVSKAGSNPETRPNLERRAIENALHHMEYTEREKINQLSKRLMECSAGTGLGIHAALQILARLGIFLNEAEGGK